MADKETKTHAALYVRLPVDEADKLDRAAFALKAAKQDLVAGLLARYVDPSSPAGLDALRDLAGAAKQGRRVTVETADDTLIVGRHEFRPAEPPAVLTAGQAAELLQVDEEAVTALADAGELPGRKVGGAWRFARQALLDWLARSR
jgi:excisionase family DNA binding protein